MKAVAMMKQAIKDSELHGYKWTADKEGLHWEYLDVTFKFRFYKDADDCTVYEFFNSEADVRARACVVTGELEQFIDDDLFFGDADKAIYKAARAIIRRAYYYF